MLNWENFKTVFTEIKKISIKHKYIEIEKDCMLKYKIEDEEFLYKQTSDLEWVLQMILMNNDYYINYSKFFNIQLVLNEYYRNYKIRSIIFRYNKKTLEITYNKEDIFLLMYILEKYKQITNYEDEAGIKSIYIDKEKKIELSILEHKEILLNQPIKLFIYENTYTPDCTFNEKKISEEF